jgi:bifunctional non-homologous end joining protein LigD
VKTRRPPGDEVASPRTAAYRTKRDPARTPEPFGGTGSSGAPIFVVQRHRARRLHYDLRLERDGALASWAVPKGLPLDRGARHLAVHVEDHPLDYARFEGEIPAGEYGAGTVEIFDTGTYATVEEKRDGGLTVELAGRRLRGVWTLVPARLDGNDANWLVLRKDDGPPRRAWQPMLASAATSPPRGEGWTFEPKWDGYRALLTVRGGEASLASRRANDLGARFPALVRQLPPAVRTPDVVLDGEICALDDRGRSRFELLQRGEGELVFVAFDLLERDGTAVAELPLSERRTLLEGTVDPSAGPLVLSPLFDDGAALLEAVRAQGLEGIVAKRLAAPYRPGARVTDWRKLKTVGREQLRVVGWAPGDGRLSRTVGSLVLGVPGDGGLRFAGSVGSGLTDDEREALLDRLGELERSTSPLTDVASLPRTLRARVRWVEPKVSVNVSFTEWTSSGRLRQPVYLGLVDEAAEPGRVDRLAFPPELRRGRRTLTFSNLDKPFWPELGLTKGDLLAYYRDLAPVLVPHLAGRPFTMKRHPDGWQGKHFFQKNAPSHMPVWITRAPFPASTREGETRLIEYPVLDDDLALLWAVSMGCIELHTWSSRSDRPERPDWVMFDLDPSDGSGFAAVVEVALLLRETLGLLELRGYPKTSGSRGIHVLVPIHRRHTFTQTRSFAGIVASTLERARPDLVTTQWSKAKRRGVLVDANQNGPGRTNAVVYSVRARPGAPVSTPVTWEELAAGVDPGALTMEVVLDRVARHGDLFAPVLSGGQSLTAALRALG